MYNIAVIRDPVLPFPARQWTATTWSLFDNKKFAEVKIV